MMKKWLTFLAVTMVFWSVPAYAQRDMTVNIGFQHGFTDYTPEGLRIEGLYAPGDKDVKGRSIIMGGGIVTADRNCHDLRDGTRYCSDSNAIQLYYGYRITRPLTRDGVLSYELQGMLVGGMAWWDYNLDTQEIGIIGGVMGRAMFLFDMGIPVTLGLGLDIGLGMGVFKEDGLDFYMPLGGSLVLRYDLE